jgi:hypothetical protein
MRPMINEVLDKIDQLETKEQKIAELKLQTRNFPELWELLAINFNFKDKGFFGLEGGVPAAYKPDLNTPEGYSDATVAGIYKRLYIYSDRRLNSKRKEELFLQEIEALHPKESDILLLVKDGKLFFRYPWIREEAFEAIFG